MSQTSTRKGGRIGDRGRNQVIIDYQLFSLTVTHCHLSSPCIIHHHSCLMILGSVHHEFAPGRIPGGNWVQITGTMIGVLPVIQQAHCRNRKTHPAGSRPKLDTRSGKTGGFREVGANPPIVGPRRADPFGSEHNRIAKIAVLFHCLCSVGTRGED